MEEKKVLLEISEIEDRIKQLPKGYISKKIIRGKCFYYHQWNENGKKYSKYVSGEKLKELFTLFEEKKNLQSKLFFLRKGKDYQSRRNILKCTLMHKNIPVVDINISAETGEIYSINQIYSLEHMPIGTIKENDYKPLSDWWNERSIPLSRSGLSKALHELDISSPRILLTKCYGLSLSDQYWIRPIDSDVSWKQVNFFNNDFSEDVGEILFGKDKENRQLDFSSPDNTSVGNLKKRWKIIDGQRILIKGGSNPFRQEPFNEVIASKIMDILNIPHVNYSMMFSGGYPYSECPNFIDENTDFISAYQIMKISNKRNDESTYTHFLRCAKELGINNVNDFLNKMIVVDFIIANEDRHLNNFGAILNVNTLQFVGMAPIFDSGSCLGFDKTPIDIYKESLIVCKPFKNTHKEQLELVNSFDFIDEDKLDEIPLIIKKVFEEEAKEYIDNNRIEAIVETVSTRINYLKSYIKTKKS